jgi:hypothetical protein
MALQPRSNQNRRLFASANLKRCPLCGAVNAHQNNTCFSCGWHGRFDRDPETVEEGLNLLIDRCPELANATNFAPKQPSFWDRITAFFRRRVDLRA